MENINEFKETKEIKQEPVMTMGVVKNCDKLNIRKKPDFNADVVGMVDVGTALTINVTGSTEDFYKVRTKSGMFGFCMKEFVEVRG